MVDEQFVLRSRGRQRDVDLPREQGCDALTGLELRDRNLEVGQLLTQERQDKRQEIRRDRRQDPQAEGAGECFLLLADDLLDLRHLKEDDSSLVKDAPPHGRGDNRLVTAVKDLDPEFVLELLDHRAQGRLRHLTIVGGAPEVSELIQRLDVLELLYIHRRRKGVSSYCLDVSSAKRSSHCFITLSKEKRWELILAACPIRRRSSSSSIS